MGRIDMQVGTGSITQSLAEASAARETIMRTFFLSTGANPLGVPMKVKLVGKLLSLVSGFTDDMVKEASADLLLKPELMALALKPITRENQQQLTVKFARYARDLRKRVDSAATIRADIAGGDIANAVGRGGPKVVDDIMAVSPQDEDVAQLRGSIGLQ
jgi:hypothetical protein